MVRYGEQIKSFHFKGKDLEALKGFKNRRIVECEEKRLDKMNRLDKSINQENRILVLKVFHIPRVHI